MDVIILTLLYWEQLNLIGHCRSFFVRTVSVKCWLSCLSLSVVYRPFDLLKCNTDVDNSHDHLHKAAQLTYFV